MCERVFCYQLNFFFPMQDCVVYEGSACFEYLNTFDAIKSAQERCD